MRPAKTKGGKPPCRCPLPSCSARWMRCRRGTGYFGNLTGLAAARHGSQWCRSAANLLVVWLLGPALRLGILALVLSFVPVLDPLFHGASLLLGIVLRLMTTLAAWCAALPVAHIALPVRYTLWVLAVFAVLAALFWRTRQLRRFVPVGFVCTVGSRYVGRHHAARCGTPGHGGHRGQWLRGGGAE